MSADLDAASTALPNAALGPAPGAAPGAACEWITVAQAARRLGVSERSIRKRIDRGTLEARREQAGNQIRTRVRVPAVPNTAPEAVSDAARDTALGADLHVQVARLEERLAAAEEIKAELRADLERERQRAEAAERRQAEQDRRLDDVLRQLAELRATPPRRPWPGAWAIWRRFWTGEG